VSSSLFRAYVIAVFVWLISIVFALNFGAVDSPALDLIIQLRLPRVILASAVGMGLAVAGAILQALFSNPLCEPYTLGISSGAALGAVLGGAIGFQMSFSGIAGSAFFGSLLFASVLYFISLKSSNNLLTVLLGGVMLGFLGSSLVALWMALADANGIQGALFWLLGDLSRARMTGSIIALIVISFLTLMLWFRWRDLDGLLVGEEGARTLGINVFSVRRTLILLTSLLVGICVSAGGMIGFVGLVVPHFVRKIVGSMHFNVIPLCALWGASTLTFADALTRFMVSPHELPVGVVTALIGAPLFLWIMLQQKERSL